MKRRAWHRVAVTPAPELAPLPGQGYPVAARSPLGHQLSAGGFGFGTKHPDGWWWVIILRDAQTFALRMGEVCGACRDERITVEPDDRGTWR